MVESLHVYPLKGAAGFSPRSWHVDERGLRHDRRFMLVDETGTFISQRTHPRMSLLRGEIVGDMLRISHATTSMEIPLQPLSSEAVRVTVWDDCLDVSAVHPDASSMISEFLGTFARLVWMPDDCPRLTHPKRGEPRRNVSFADAAPLLLTTTASLHELNSRLERDGSSAIPMNRFRANVVVHGPASGDDDHWRALQIGSAAFRVSNACKRCKVITIDQSSGESTGSDPLRILADYRSEGQGVTFGQHLLVEHAGIINVGDPVSIDGRAS